MDYYAVGVLFVPYGLISAELGTQYPSEGGMYTWVKKAFGPKWAGARCLVLLGKLSALDSFARRPRHDHHYANARLRNDLATHPCDSSFLHPLS